MKRTVTTTDFEHVVSENGRPMLRGKCAVCKTIKIRFVSNGNGGDLVSSSRRSVCFQLPWAKYPGEMHLPGMNFVGPGTRLDLRLDSSGRPKPDSIPVDRVDEAAYRHDVAYEAFRDTKSRNVADRVMVNELNEIPNPTLRERATRAVIKPILRVRVCHSYGGRHS